MMRGTSTPALEGPMSSTKDPPSPDDNVIHLDARLRRRLDEEAKRTGRTRASVFAAVFDELFGPAKPSRHDAAVRRQQDEAEIRKLVEKALEPVIGSAKQATELAATWKELAERATGACEQLRDDLAEAERQRDELIDKLVNMADDWRTGKKLDMDDVNQWLRQGGYFG
jgi:hypothetical protein